MKPRLRSLCLGLLLAVCGLVPAVAAERLVLTDHEGAARAWSEIAGQANLVYFGFTHCPDICPTALADISDALDLLGLDGEGLRPVFVTLDPARDTSDALAEYVAHFHPRLLGLTGTPETIAALAARYRIAFEKRPLEGGGDYLIDHSSKIMLIGPDGALRASFLHGIRPEQLARELRRWIAVP
ncbi:MAG: SCO family protein [Kiloniellales bacterium]|nr:SCO family protein [Kiloniellales bacterium]